MKRLISVLLLLALVLIPMSSCGDGNETKTQTEGKNMSETESKTEKVSESETEFKPVIEYYEGDADAVIYADAEKGNDDSGDGSPDAPFETLPKAYEAAVDAVNGGKANVAVFLRSGTYRLTEELMMTSKDITAEEYHITVTCTDDIYGGAVITTNVDIDGSDFEEVPGEDYCVYQLPDESRDEDGNYPAFRDLYLNGEALTLATSDKDATMLYDTCAKISTANASKFSASDRLLYIRPSLIAGIPTDEEGYFLSTDGEGNVNYDDGYNPIHVQVEIWFKLEWQLHCIHIEQVVGETEYVDSETSENLVSVRVTAEDWTLFSKSGTYCVSLADRPYWLSNMRCYLNEPGDFYYDRAAGMIYVYDNRRLDKSTISYPTAERILNLSDMKHLTLENLTFTGVTVNYITDNGYIAGQGGYIKKNSIGFLAEGAVYGENVADITICGCTFTNVGGDGVNFRGAVDNVVISDSVFENVSGTAIRFGVNNTYNNTLHNCGITITNNYLHNIGTVFLSNPGIMITSVRDLELSYNTIVNTAYTAISIGYTWNATNNDSDSFVNIKNADISHNYIEDFMSFMADGGAIYVLGGNASSGYDGYLNSMNGNVVVVKKSIASGVKRGGANTGWTVYYHDGSASHWHDYDNMLILEENMQRPISDYVAYQTVSAQQAYRNLTERLYVVGYIFEDNPTMVGSYILGSLAHRYNYSYEKDEETGAYTLHDEHQEGYNNYAKDVYLFTDFDDENITDTAYADMKEIFDTCGSDRGRKPLGFGELPVSEEY